MKKTVLLSFFSCVLVVSCNEEPKASKKITSKERVVIDAVKANQFVTFEVKGMVCKMGCGSTIRKALLNTKAVASCEIQFESDRVSNFVQLGFDKNKISKEKLITVIEQLNKHQFKVIDSKDNKQQTSIKKNSIETINPEAIENNPRMEETNVDMPNLIDIYTRLVTS